MICATNLLQRKSLGTPVPVGVCARYSLGQSLARVKISWRSTPAPPKSRDIVSQKVHFSVLRAQHPLRAEILCPEKSTLWSIYITLNNFFVCGPKFTFFLSNVGGVVGC